MRPTAALGQVGAPVKAAAWVESAWAGGGQDRDGDRKGRQRGHGARCGGGRRTLGMDARLAMHRCLPVCGHRPTGLAVTDWRHGGNPPTRLGTPAPRALLALRAEERGAVHERDPADRRTAARARQALLAVRRQRAVEVARLAVDVDVERVEAGAALTSASPSTSRTWPSSSTTCPRRAGRRAVAVQPRPPQRLVGVDVADPGDQALVEQQPLDAGGGADPAMNASSSNSGSTGSRAMCAISAAAPLPRRHQEPAEHPLVDEPQLGPSAVERTGPGGGVRRPRRRAG